MTHLPHLFLATHNVDAVFGPWWSSFSGASAIVTAILAPQRGRNAFIWLLIGGALPWISIVILYVLRDLKAPPYPMMPMPAGGPIPGPGPMPGSPAGLGMPPAPPAAPDSARFASVSEPAVALPQDGWFYALRRQAMGPVSLPYLRGAIAMGTLGRDVPVWCPSFREWTSPARIPGFFG